ncbi:MAG: hypothetical protein GVY06_07575 [Alphaproteobacteria bacterium]|jgi:hypothetical protein|nr:hypothetical protein [Alphaproteobacteria bacterium]
MTITLWCVILFVVNAVAAGDLWAVWQATANPAGLEARLALGLSAFFALCALVALVSITWVRALWFLIGAAGVKLALALRLMFTPAHPVSVLVAGAVLAEIVISYLVMVMNRVDNPAQQAPDPAEEF